MKAFNKKNRLFSFAIIILLVVIGFSLQLLAGNVFYYQGQRFVKQAKNSKIKTEQQAYISSAIALLDKALFFDEQADYLELKASLLVWQANQQNPINTANINNALALYQQALQQRPSWPYAWLGIVEAKIIAKQFDDVLEKAINQSVNLGFYEAMVQKQLLQLTLPSYRKLSLKSRRKVFAMYQQALKANNQSPMLIKLGKSAGIFTLFCILQKQKTDELYSNISKACHDVLALGKNA